MARGLSVCVNWWSPYIILHLPSVSELHWHSFYCMIGSPYLPMAAPFMVIDSLLKLEKSPWYLVGKLICFDVVTTFMAILSDFRLCDCQSAFSLLYLTKPIQRGKVIPNCLSSYDIFKQRCWWQANSNRNYRWCD